MKKIYSLRVHGFLLPSQSSILRLIHKTNNKSIHQVLLEEIQQLIRKL